MECHGTGTPVGDPIEAKAVARVFGKSGVYIGSVKPNLGHSEGASGLTSLIKAVLALENRTIPPNIKFTSPNPKIPFEEGKLTIPLEPTSWPESRCERISVNSFGIGGANAHVVLDSARSFNLPPSSSKKSSQSTTKNSQLLLVSANCAPSLQKLTTSLQQWANNNPGNLESLAYTLANRREHLPYRAFMITNRDGVIGGAPQGRKIPNHSPNLVMVFTGQGAQWPRMGRELLQRSDLCFQSSIRSLDKYLREAHDAPGWTLEEELLKPAKTSGVQRAELSQPLCTAVQIALVDLFAAVGVEPYAVVGHSSGEIAAAYAAGALTAKEAIIAAWQRGRAAKKQSRPGAMAAVGLSWNVVESFLTSPKVVVACENSPRSITLSGDADEVQATVSRIKKAHPDVTARLLQVEKAYHSYHMREVGEEYSSILRRDILGTPPSKPFFSSVTGTGTYDEVLDAKYWQRNLECPVLFRAAVTGILETVENVAFLEIGPHPALAGPVRQILTQASSSASYVGAMNRGESSVESFLAAIGKLFELNVPVDLKKLMPTGSCLPDLPRYPWDHEANYWRESRISHEWRNRKFPAHPLLGVRQLESTGLEPSFRNLLLIDHASWLRDHKIEDNVIFPCAGYISMIGEGIRQISTSHDAFSLRHVVLSSALVLSDGIYTELVTNFRPVHLTDALDSQWWEFSISSHNGHVWTKHCSGQVTSENVEVVQAPEATLLPRKIERQKFYDVLTRAGMGYGPHFQRLEDIRTGTTDQLAVAQLSSDLCGDEEHYHLHPTVIDACLQSGPLAATKGRVDAKHSRRVPTKIDKVTVHRCAPDVSIRVSASATFIQGSDDVVGRAQCISNGNIVLDLEGTKLSSIQAEAAEAESFQTTARLTWGPHIDFLDITSLIKPEIPRHLYTPSLDELARLCLVYSQRRIKGAQTGLPHIKKYMNWIERQVQCYGADSPITKLDDAMIKDEISNLVQVMAKTPVKNSANAIQKVVNNIEGILSGQTDPLEMLLTDGILTNVYVDIDAIDRTQFIRHMAHSKPSLRILEVGAGTGASTASILKDLVSPVGQPLYSKYTFTDISSGFFVSAKDRFKNYRNIEYRTLDIGKDLVEQGFEGDKYDLVIATNVLHVTTSLSETLKIVHELLEPNGRLLLHELDSPSKWPNYIFGTLPGWWLGEPDGRPDEPYVTPDRWEAELRRAGFDGLDAVVLDAEEPYQLNAIMVAKPRAERKKAINKTVSLLCDDEGSYADALSQSLDTRGFTVQRYRLGEELPASQDVISLLDGARPFFKDTDGARFTAFQRLLDNLSPSGLFWVTHASQIQCRDPSYAQVIGAARTIRNEALLDFATCEVDDMSSSIDKVVDVFAKFQARVEDELLKPDYEYAIINDTINVGRIYPFSIQDELVLQTGPEGRFSLDMARPGRLNTLQWASREERLLRGDDVEVKIYTAGLNFKVRSLSLFYILLKY